MITKQDLYNEFKSLLDQVQNTEWKEKALKVWLNACEKGGWNSLDEIRKMPFTLLTDHRGINFLEHTIAVTEGALGLAKAQTNTYKSMPYKINLDRVIVGGLLHDVGKLVEIEPDGNGGYRKSHNGKCTRHPISGTVLAAMEGMPDEILNIIVCHAKEGEGRPQVIEAVLIHQADFATFDPLVMKVKGLLIED